MPGFILNDIEMNARLLIDFRNMINELTPKFLSRLEDFIQEKVYDVGHPSYYQRNGYSGGFIGSWSNTDAQIVLQTIQSIINNNPNLMIAHTPGDKNDFTHGSEYWKYDDVRDLLAEIINEGKSGPLFGDGYWREPRRFWEAFIEFIDSPESDKIFEQIMTNFGLVWIKI